MKENASRPLRHAPGLPTPDTRYPTPDTRPFSPCHLITAIVALLVFIVAATPARAQDASATVARALTTLENLDRLLARIQARRAASLTQRPGAKARVEAGEAQEGGQSLFDGRSLAGWKRTAFAGGGEVRVDPAFRDGGPAIVVEAGATLSGLNWTGDVPRFGYEIALEMLKIDGSDFACGLTFPVGEAYASLILGGWGGGTVGISCIDGLDASENETTRYRRFPPGRWFRVRMRVTAARLQAWLDDEKIVDVAITGRRIGLRPGEIVRSIPLGLATYQTSAAFRNIHIRRL